MRISSCHTVILALTLWVAPGLASAHAQEASGTDRTLWLTLNGAQRTRYEHLFNQFRGGRPGDDRALSLRTSLNVELRFQSFRIHTEIMDSRAYLADANTPIDASVVNPVDLLQGYLAYGLDDFIVGGADGQVRAGRFTLELRSRRLVARNRFRNTVNAHTGIDLQWSNPGSLDVRAFATLPVQRLPSASEDLEENRGERDRESFDVVFWGAFVSAPSLIGDVTLESFLFGLHERDGADRPTRDRSLITTGFGLFRAPASGEFDLDVESAIQFGTSRSTADPGNNTDLDHLALFAHLAAGFTLDAPWSPRVVAQYDYASGDGDPEDGDNGRFDALFGARRFEFGPTGIYGAIARSNIHSPGVRIEARPSSATDVFVGYHPFWLAEARDGWTTSGLQDTTGGSGSFVGHQLETRARWRVKPEHISLDVGVANLIRGRFARETPGANPGGDTTEIYAQVTLAF